MKNWRPISFLNVDTKIFSKANSNKLKTVPWQTAYLKNKFIGESCRLISDIVEIIGWFNITCFLVTMDTEKAFYSLEDFIFVLKKFCFGKKL